MTAEEINAVAEALLRELEKIKDSPSARSWRRVLINLALEGVRLQTLADMQRSPPAPVPKRRPAIHGERSTQS
jgi:hypothetical protein